MAFCKTCGSEILAEAEICPKCGVRQKTDQLKNPGAAAVLSFLWVGLGQIYNGQIGKGLLFIFLQIINCLLIFVVIGLITVPAFWIYGIYDAYTTADKINKGESVPTKVSLNF
jgi:TM2 domain-containing membrane protein YozV